MMATVTKRPYKIPKHKYWVVIEDKYLVDYSEDMKIDIAEESFSKYGGCKVCGKPLFVHRRLRFCKMSMPFHCKHCGVGAESKQQLRVHIGMRH